MEDKYVVTSDFTSLHDLKKFIRLVNKAGGSVSMSETDKLLMLEDTMLVPNTEAEYSFSPQSKFNATLTNDLERGKAVPNTEICDEAEQSAAYLLLRSVTNFTGARPTPEVRSL